MADVTLAECNGNIWLVGGERYVDDLLFNTLPDGVSIELISCDDRDQVRKIWIQNCGEPLPPSEPMLVNPSIAERVRRSTPGRTVFFTQWSAMMDPDAIAVLRAAASWMVGSPSLKAVLVEYVPAKSVPGLAELSKLRLTLIASKLTEFGVAPERLSQRTRPPTLTIGPHQDNQRVDIEIAEV